MRDGGSGLEYKGGEGEVRVCRELDRRPWGVVSLGIWIEGICHGVSLWVVCFLNGFKLCSSELVKYK